LKLLLILILNNFIFFRQVQEEMKSRRQLHISINEKMNGVVGLTSAILSFEILRNPSSSSGEALLSRIDSVLEEVCLEVEVLQTQHVFVDLTYIKYEAITEEREKEMYEIEKAKRRISELEALQCKHDLHESSSLLSSNNDWT